MITVRATPDKSKKKSGIGQTMRSCVEILCFVSETASAERHTGTHFGAADGGLVELLAGDLEEIEQCLTDERALEELAFVFDLDCLALVFHSLCVVEDLIDESVKSH